MVINELFFFILGVAIGTLRTYAASSLAFKRSMDKLHKFVKNLAKEENEKAP